MDKLISELIDRRRQATAEQLARIAAHVAAAPFADDLLEIDEPLWGGFWQGDVLGPGYRLPAVELALLRAIRLDGHWPEGTTAAQFLADLRRAITHPQAGVWLLTAAGEPGVVFAAASGEREAENEERLTTVVWYCAITGRLHAGYRTPVELVHLAETIELRGFELGDKSKPMSGSEPDWITQTVKQKSTGDHQEFVARLDLEILNLRVQL